MSTHNISIKKLKDQAERSLGKSWDEIIKQADQDTQKQKEKKDPIEYAYTQSKISPNKMFKDSMKKICK